MDRRARRRRRAAAGRRVDGGRPIIATDLRNPSKPQGYPHQPVDLFRQDGVTAYSHDVDVDAPAWRGSPASAARAATGPGPALRPGQGQASRGDAARPGPVRRRWARRRDRRAECRRWDAQLVAPGRPDAPLTDCATSRASSCSAPRRTSVPAQSVQGPRQVHDLLAEGLDNGEGWRSTPDKPFRLKPSAHGARISRRARSTTSRRARRTTSTSTARS